MRKVLGIGVWGGGGFTFHLEVVGDSKIKTS